MTTNIESSPASISGWTRLIQWMRGLDEALDYDPAEQSINRLNHKITSLEERIRQLEAGA